VSTGGPNALAALLPNLPAGFPVPILIVQHMPPLFTKLLADRLSAKSALAVSEAKHGDEVVAGRAWLAPGDFHMQVGRAGNAVRIGLDQGPPENSCRPAVDPLFRSMVKVYGPHVLGIVLTGMGQDGLRGSQAIREAGGHVIVQDEASSVVWGMPGYVAEAGLADLVLPLEQLPAEITRRVRVAGPSDAPRRAMGA
jgi:two-component system chemotaxis response regulator CheB